MDIQLDADAYNHQQPLTADEDDIEEAQEKKEKE
ncbi:hypothetical protein ABIB62_001962 [Mucilaginibacter sp. UYP25]